MSPRGILRRAVIAIVYAAAVAALLLGGLRLIDRTFARDRLRFAGLDAESRALTIRTLELFPFDGFHIQANMRHRGPMPWNEHTPEADFDIRSGEKGFFIDFSLEDPPPKQANEFRIILIGGSGAQGWGATRNENMFYSVLERELGEKFASQNIRVRVINLAMAGSVTYQNFIALNRWGHALEPDLILAYVGRNDFFVPLYHSGGTDLFADFDQLGAFVQATRGSEYPPGMAWLMDLLPNVMRHTSLGLGIKVAFGWDYFPDRALKSYYRSSALPVVDERRVLRERATPLLIHGLQSIKRDFGGVPIMVGWQAVGPADLAAMGDVLPPGFYDAMYEQTRRGLEGYVNDGWYFVNVHQIGRAMPQGRFEAHLDDAAHAITGKLFAERIGPIMQSLVAAGRPRPVPSLKTP